MKLFYDRQSTAEKFVAVNTSPRSAIIERRDSMRTVRAIGPKVLGVRKTISARTTTSRKILTIMHLCLFASRSKESCFKYLHANLTLFTI